MSSPGIRKENRCWCLAFDDVPIIARDVGAKDEFWFGRHEAVVACQFHLFTVRKTWNV